MRFDQLNGQNGTIVRALPSGDGYEVELAHAVSIKHTLQKVVTFLAENLKEPGAATTAEEEEVNEMLRVAKKTAEKKKKEQDEEQNWEEMGKQGGHTL